MLSEQAEGSDGDSPGLSRLLADRSLGPVEDVEANRLDFATAHAITAPFIVTPEYGTRCSTVVIADHSGQWRMIERRFDRQGVSIGECRFTFATHA